MSFLAERGDPVATIRTGHSSHRSRKVVAFSLGFQALYVLVSWRWAELLTGTYPLILIVLPGLMLGWFVLQPSFLLGALIIGGANLAYHLGLAWIWAWVRGRVRPGVRR